MKRGFAQSTSGVILIMYEKLKLFSSPPKEQMKHLRKAKVENKSIFNSTFRFSSLSKKRE